MPLLPWNVVEPTETASAFQLTDPLFVVLLTLGAALVPVYIGVGLVQAVDHWPRRQGWLLGSAGGILFASFFDLLKETAGLSTGTLRSANDVANIVAFSVALIVLLAFQQYGARQGWIANGALLLYLWAIIGVGLHSLGEGVVIGYSFVTGVTTLSVAQGLSFALHKLGEGFTIGVVAALGAVRSRHLAVSALAGGVPATLGAVLGLGALGGTAVTIAFAASVGATVYVLARLLMREGTSREQTILGVLVGFLYMYFAGVLHQFE